MHQGSNILIVSQRKRYRNALRIIAACVGVAMVYPLFAREITDLVALLNSFLIGLLGGLGIAMHQDYLTYSPRLKSFPFIASMLVTTLLYTVGFGILIMGMVGVTRGLESGLGVPGYLQSDTFRDFLVEGDFRFIMIWALFMSLLLSFGFRMRTKVAGNILHNMIFGRYARPRQEFRAFMYIDLNDATSIAERLKEERYFRFLNDFYMVITPAILASDGEIYRYVGDEVTVSWVLRKGFDPSSCITTAFQSTRLLESKREYFMREYGVMPAFKAALHCGHIIAGELGDVKSQLVFHGDVMYVTERIEKSCRKFNKKILVSDVLLEMMDLPAIYEQAFCGELSLTDNKALRLFTVEEKSMFVPE